MIRIIGALLLLALPALAAPAPVKLKVGDPAPLFARADLQGHAFDLKAQRGKIVLIDFWASWCAPCMIEIPHLGGLQDRYGKNGFQVVGISSPLIIGGLLFAVCGVMAATKLVRVAPAA